MNYATCKAAIRNNYHRGCEINSVFGSGGWGYFLKY